MKAYYLCPVIGTGAYGDGWRPKVAEHGLNVSPVIPTGPDGRPLFNWCLCHAAGANHDGPRADPAVDAMPDLTLDSTLSTLTTQQRNRLFSALDKYNVPRADMGNNTTFREVIRRVGQFLEPTFSESNFDAKE